MGSYDGAEACELIGAYMLNRIKLSMPQSQLGLYRDDGLCIVPNSNGPKIDKIKKNITKIFKDEGLNITVEANIDIVNFLDVTLNIKTQKFSPFQKPNNTPQYINTKSNHPPNIIKELPRMIERRLSEISSDKTEFVKSKDVYQTALTESGYTEKIEYQDTQQLKKKKRRNRKIIWFNPPYSKHVTTSIGNQFFRLLNKHFPKGHQFHKIFNRNTVKLSYSCAPNVARIIKSINSKILCHDSATSDAKECNCRDKNSCPLQKKMSHKDRSLRSYINHSHPRKI